MQIMIRYTSYKYERHPVTYCRRLELPEGADISDLCRQTGVIGVVEFVCQAYICKPRGSEISVQAECLGHSTSGILTQGPLKDNATYTLSGFGDQRYARRRFERFEFQEQDKR